MSDDFQTKHNKNHIKTDFTKGFKTRRISQILPRDQITINGKIYKRANDSLLYNAVSLNK